MRVLANLDTLKIENAGALPPSTATGVGARQGLKGRIYSKFVLEVGFFRSSSNDVLLDLGADIGVEWILKRSTGAQKYDEAVIQAAVDFVRSAEGDDFIYSGVMDLGQPVFEKLLGVDVYEQKEVLEIECVADVAGSLSGKYVDISYVAGATSFHRFWFNPGAGVSPAAGGGTLVEVAYTANDSATDIANALAGVATVGGHWLAGNVGDTATLEAVATGAKGFHHPRNSGFTLTTTQAGMTGGTTADEDSVELIAELSFELDGERQILELFRFVVENTPRRPGIANPGVSGAVTVQRTLPIGGMIFYGGVIAPTGFAFPYGQAISRTTYAECFELMNPSVGVCTISNASPGVVTRAAHGLVNGDAIYFTTTGALPTGLAANTRYFVVSSATNTFSVSATRGGAAINTSSAGSGVHTLRRSPHGIGDGSTTFNMPDVREMALVGAPLMGGVSAGRLDITGADRGGFGGEAVGATGGAATHTLVPDELPTGTLMNTGSANLDAGGGPSIVAQAAGDDAPHNNVQPTMLLPVIMRIS